MIDASDVGDLECLQAISRLYFEEMLIDLDHGAPVRRDTGRSMPLVELPETPTPIEDAASGPIDDQIDPDPEIISEGEPGALMGGYRQSSLILIDAAVAAAQAIDPSLFDDEIDKLDLPEPVLSDDRPGSNGGVPVAEAPTVDDETANPDDSIPHAIEQDEPSPPPRESVRPPSPPEPPRLTGREDSSLRMIGSLGRDRAEASGELRPVGSPQVPLTSTQRELVTILPRRITRELAITTVEPDLRPGEPAPAQPVAKPVELPSPRIPSAGSGVRRKAGPTGGALVLLILAAVLAGLAVYLRLRDRPAPESVPVIDDDGGLVATVPDAALAEPLGDAGVGIDDVPRDAPPTAPPDARVSRRLDAATRLEEDIKQSKVLMDQANDALQEQDYERTIELANASLKLRRTARTYLVRAQAMQRLSRVEEALQSIDQAEKLSPRFPAVFELRGRILWAARREDEARIAFEQFLELSPNGATAAQVRQLLNRPR